LGQAPDRTNLPGVSREKHTGTKTPVPHLIFEECFSAFFFALFRTITFLMNGGEKDRTFRCFE
jgi:hypothetical protein